MITSHSNQSDIKPKRARLLGDAALIRGLVESRIPKLILLNTGEAFYQICRQYVRANGVILSFGISIIFRYRHGSLVSGIGLTVFFLSMLLVFNSTHLWTPALTPVAVFSIPFLPIWKSADDLYRLAFVDIHSQNLLIYAGLFTLASLTTTVMNWLGYGNKNLTKRGESWLFFLLDKLLSRHVKVSEFFVTCFLETGIAIGAGIYLCTYGGDPYFGAFLILMAVNEIILGLTEKSAQMHAQTILNL